MKMTDYNSVQNLKENNIFVIDGPDGTKQITAHDLADSLIGISLKTSDDLYDILDDVIPPVQRRMMWRGKNLGAVVTDDLYEEIDAGTFKGIFLGDYWEIGGRIWRVVDFDYWYDCGDTSCTTHHLVIMPDHQLYTGQMNTTNNTTGAYVNSAMYKTGLAEAKTIVNGAFTAAHVLNHREYLQNATTSGYASAGAWFDSTAELPNEPMMYGSYIHTPAGNGTIVVNRHTISKTQLAGMRVNPTLINPHRETQWLRDVVSAVYFARVSHNGYAYYYDASNALGVRVVFGLCKANAA